MYIVTNTFRDKYTGHTYLPGDSFVSNEAERVKDLLTRKLIDGEPLPDVNNTEHKKPAKKATKRKTEKR